MASDNNLYTYTEEREKELQAKAVRSMAKYLHYKARRRYQEEVYVMNDDSEDTPSLGYVLRHAAEDFKRMADTIVGAIANMILSEDNDGSVSSHKNK